MDVKNIELHYHKEKAYHEKLVFFSFKLFFKKIASPRYANRRKWLPQQKTECYIYPTLLPVSIDRIIFITVIGHDFPGKLNC